MIILGFYKAPGSIQDWLVRLVTRSKYSHVEILEFTTDFQGLPICIGYTASAKHGVIIRQICYKETSWDLQIVDWVNEKMAYAFFKSQVGQKYDWLEIFFTHLFHCNWKMTNHWVCSEIIAHILGFTNPNQINPGQLYDLVNDITHLGYDVLPTSNL